MAERVKWRVLWAAFFFTAALSLTLIACGQQPDSNQVAPEDSYDSLIMDFSWMTLSGHQQNALCKQWREGTEDEFRDVLVSAGTDMSIEDEWFDMMRRHC